MEQYSFNLAWSDEDNDFVATCPEFPGLSAFGPTRQEALAEGEIALGLMIETCKEDGITLPEPKKVDYSKFAKRAR